MFKLKRFRYIFLLLFVITVGAGIAAAGRFGPFEQAVGFVNGSVRIAARWSAMPFGSQSALKKQLAESLLERARLLDQLSCAEERSRRLGFLLGLKRSEFAAARRGVVARVAARTPESWHSSVIVDRGVKDGVQRGYAALTGDGVVGRVDAVTPTTATVLLITGEDNATSVSVPKKSVYGIAFGDGTGMIDIRSLPYSVPLRRGDLVVTSGYGGNYPAGLPVGRISDVKVVHEELSPRIRVRPAADMANLYYLLLAPK